MATFWTPAIAARLPRDHPQRLRALLRRARDLGGVPKPSRDLDSLRRYSRDGPRRVPGLVSRRPALPGETICGPLLRCPFGAIPDSAQGTLSRMSSRVRPLQPVDESGAAVSRSDGSWRPARPPGRWVISQSNSVAGATPSRWRYRGVCQRLNARRRRLRGRRQRRPGSGSLP